jgi:hypothetical protein
MLPIDVLTTVACIWVTIYYAYLDHRPTVSGCRAEIALPFRPGHYLPALVACVLYKDKILRPLANDCTWFRKSTLSCTGFLPQCADVPKISIRKSSTSHV